MENYNEMSPSIVTVAEDTTLTSSNFTVLVDATDDDVVIALPAAADNLARMYNVKKIDASANTVTITPDGAETIDAYTTLVLTLRWQSVTIQSNGTGWSLL